MDIKGLWYKGLTSGATQKIIKISRDCDGDSLQFVVHQKDPGTFIFIIIHGSVTTALILKFSFIGYCHLNTRTCFGKSSGLSALEESIRHRKTNAPPSSYTAKLFSNPSMLSAKIMEEASELCSAVSAEEIAEEMADVIYFAMVRCVGAGVSLDDVEAVLEKRSRRVTRRPGLVKPQWEKLAASKSAGSSSTALNTPNASLEVATKDNVCPCFKYNSLSIDEMEIYRLHLKSK
jgi:phosphoribosyl-ATP pyrophosphohydrolase / phosphoribosyl-AMP cyclohydrolase / histidinol dehydrogenase